MVRLLAYELPFPMALGAVQRDVGVVVATVVSYKLGKAQHAMRGMSETRSKQGAHLWLSGQLDRQDNQNVQRYHTYSDA